MIKSTTGHYTNQSSIITHHNKILKKINNFLTHIYIIESISPLKIVKHTRLIQIRQLGHIVYSNMIFLIRISRIQFLRRSQHLTKPQKSQILHREKKDKIGFWFLVFHLLSRRGNELDLFANGAEDLSWYPSEISVLGPNL